MQAKYAERYELYKQGMNDTEIAEIEGVTRSNISSWRWNHKLPNNGTGFTKPRVSTEGYVLTPEQRDIVAGFFQELLNGRMPLSGRRKGGAR